MRHIVICIVVVVLGLLGAIYLKIALSPSTFETCIIYNQEDIQTIDYKKHNKLTISASTLYDGDALKDILQGQNYRDAWTTKVDVPVLFLDTLYGGMKVVKEGGGKQTQSLRLAASNGLYVTLRSVNKNPEKLIPDFAKNLGLENIVIDGISAQHPYASVVVASLSDEINLLHTHPKYVFLPKQSTLSSYNDAYGDRLYTLEFENKGTYNWTGLTDVFEIMDTEDLQKLKMKAASRLTIDTDLLVRARLFDLVIGDWDRHTKQWGWVVTENDSIYKAYPLPMDRDNAFFKIEGLIPTLISDESFTPKMQSFNHKIDFIEGLIYDFDIYFLQNVPDEVFISQAMYIQKQLSNESIDTALRKWNTELYDLYAEEISTKLKHRRDNLVEIATRFKSVLDSEPLLNKPLKGSEDIRLGKDLVKCFDCI